MSEKDKIVEELLKKPCYVIDILPERVPADSKGQFLAVEHYFLSHFKEYHFKEKFTRILLKVICYYQASIFFGDWVDQPTPEMIVDVINEIVDNCYGILNILIPEKNVLLVFEWDCLNMSVYNPDEDMQRIIKSLAAAEGLFFWEAGNGNI